MINLTLSRFGVEKNAVPVGEFLQRLASTNFSYIKGLKFIGVLDALFSSNRLDLLLVDPDPSRGTGAAVAAARTGKLQSVLIPRRRFWLFFGHGLFVNQKMNSPVTEIFKQLTSCQANQTVAEISRIARRVASTSAIWLKYPKLNLTHPCGQPIDSWIREAQW